jgi:hypothetical protein
MRTNTIRNQFRLEATDQATSTKNFE